MNHGQNTGGGENPNRATGNFKLNIDERDLATGNIDLPERRSQPPRPEYSVNKAYLTEKERRAERKAHKKRDKLKARKNRRIFALVWVCMVLLVSFTLASYLIKGSNDFFAVGRSQGTTSVTIPENVTLDDLTQILYEAGAIKEPEFFSLFCMVTVDDDEMEYFQPGTYNLDTNLDYQAIISTLQGGNQTREEVRVTFPEGTTALEAAALLEENGVCSQEDFLAAINSTDFDSYEAIAPIAAITGKYYKLEGYLFPDTYDFYKGEEIDSVVGKLVNNFQNRTADLQEDIAASGMTLDQVVTLASIIQREAANTQDMANVSAVLHNRLAFGAEYGIYRLQCDSTTFYPYKREEDVPASGALAYGNYDTYEVQGLPAGAICNPGLDAIEAALHPNTEGDAPYYLYFCHASDGTAYYATNEADHQYNLQLGGSVDVDHLVAVLLSSFLRGVGFFRGWRTALTTAREDIILFVIIHIGICFGILVDSEDVSQTIYHGHGSYSLRLLSCINCTKKAPIGFCHNYTVFIIFHFCFVVNTNITECGAKRPFSVLTAACRPAGCCLPRSPHRTGAARYPPPLCRLPVQGCRYRPHIKW